jgi:ATP/maltotriose-dependent transcriptional regulator MalT
MITRAFHVGVACFTADARTGEAMQRCHEALQGHDPLPNQLPYLARAQGWAALASGDRAGAPAAIVARSVSVLREQCDARLMDAYAAHAAARAGSDGPELLAVVDEFERIGALRSATEAAADAATAFLRAGRQDSARRAAVRSRELFIDGQGGSPPVIDGLTAEAIGLSPREAELVELAKQGLSNPEIAERLVLSKRTVESHLYRATQKL